MDYKSFLERVRQALPVESEGEARRITEAALETLGERLSKTEREHLAAQLPAELKGAVFRRHTDRFPLEEFYKRFAARANLSYHRAVKWSRAVMSVLRAAVAPGELDDILSEIAAEYQELFGKEPESPASPTYLPEERAG